VVNKVATLADQLLVISGVFRVGSEGLDRSPHAMRRWWDALSLHDAWRRFQPRPLRVSDRLFTIYCIVIRSIQRWIDCDGAMTWLLAILVTRCCARFDSRLNSSSYSVRILYYTGLRKGRRRSKEEVGHYSLLYVWLIPQSHVECSDIRSGHSKHAVQSSQHEHRISRIFPHNSLQFTPSTVAGLPTWNRQPLCSWTKIRECYLTSAPGHCGVLFSSWDGYHPQIILTPRPHPAISSIALTCMREYIQQ